MHRRPRTARRAAAGAASARARARCPTRCAMPPESWLGYASLKSASPTVSRNASAIAARIAAVVSARAQPDGDVLPHGHPGKEPRLLERHAEMTGWVPVLTGLPSQLMRCRSTRAAALRRDSAACSCRTPKARRRMRRCPALFGTKHRSGRRCGGLPRNSDERRGRRRARRHALRAPARSTRLPGVLPRRAAMARLCGRSPGRA